MYFCYGVACEYFGMYKTQSRIVHAVGFLGGPRFEASVHHLNVKLRMMVLLTELFLCVVAMIIFQGNMSVKEFYNFVVVDVLGRLS